MSIGVFSNFAVLNNESCEGEQEIIETKKSDLNFLKKDLVMLIKFISFAHAKMVNKRTV